jgi:hypothetical protein
MKNKQKLLAEHYLYAAASRFFDEEPTIAKEKKLDEKMVTATLSDGRKIIIDDEDFTWRWNQSDANEYIGDDEPNPNLDEPGTPGTYTGAASKAAQAALNKQNSATRFSDRASAGQKIYNALADEINTVVKEFANEQIKKGRIIYDDELGEWVIGNDDPKAIKQLLSMLEVKVYQEVIKPAKATLKKGQQDALLATFHKTFTNPAHVKDGTPAFKGAKLLLKKTLNGMKESTGASETFDVDSEGLAEAFYKACDTVLTEMYAKRYDVEPEEAYQMFILRDTPAAESTED